MQRHQHNIIPLDPSTKDSAVVVGKVRHFRIQYIMVQVSNFFLPQLQWSYILGTVRLQVDKCTKLK